MSILDSIFDLFGPTSYSVDWYCDECGEHMNSQSGFSTSTGEWTCTYCGCVNDVTEDNIVSWDFGDEDDDDDDRIPEGCAACGNPAYPNCKTSCNIFDD